MKIKLNIHQSNQVKSVDLKEQTVNHLRFEAQSLYQLVDENNQALEQVFWKKQGDDVLFFLNEHDKQPILVLHDGNDFLAAMHFPQAQTSTLIETVKASQVAAAPNWALLGLGGAVLLGGGLAAAKGGSSSHDKNRADNTSDKAENKNSSSQNNAQKLRDAEIAKQKAEQAQKQAENNLKQANADLAVALRDKKAAEDALKAAQNSGSKNIADLQKQLDTVNQTVQNAELAKNRAETELANVRNQLKQAENAAQSDKTRLENELNHANTAKEQAQTALQKANTNLANALRDKKAAEDNLKAAQEQGSKDIADLQAQLDEANQRVQAAENAQKLAENQAKADKTRLENELNSANENLAAALRDKKTAEDNLKAAQEQGSTDIAKLQTQLEAANQAVQTAQADKAAAESALTDVRTQLTQAETEKTRLQNELNNTNTAKEQVQTALQKANADLANALRDKKTAEDNLKAAQEQGSTDIANLQTQLETANQAVQTAQADKAAAESALTDVRTQLAQAEIEKTRLQNELNNTNTAKEQAQTALEKANADLANALRDKKTAEDNLKTAQEQGSKDIADLQAQLDEANQRVQTAENAQKLAENQARADKTRLENELNNANENLATALRDKKTAEDNLKAAQEQGSKDIADLQAQLDEANQKVQAAEEAKTNAETAKKATESEVLRLNGQLSQANTDLATALNDKKTAEDNLKAAQEQGSKDIADLQNQLKAANDKVKAAATDLSNLRNQFENDLNEAKTAKEKAETDLQTAQNDLANAIAAKEAAEKAQENAENALKAAQEKGEKADALQAQLDTANTTLHEKELALTDAQNAKTLAETQRDDALTAQNTAEKAKEAAEKALADFQAAQAEAIKNNPPQIRFNDLTADNVINASEANSPEIEISGSVNNMQPNDVLNIKIGNTSHIIPVEQGNFALKVNGNLLSDKPVVSAEITRNNEKVADKTHTYEVDTQIDTPIITFNPITEDNIINLDESKQNAIEVSGTVQHFQQGEQLLVQIGEANPMRVAIQDNGTFSFWVAGQTFANHPSIQASLTTKDEAGNTATASKMAEYTVDVIAPTPSITLNQIAGDNIINKTESEQATTEISGTVSGLEEGNQVMLLCSCQSCSSPVNVVEIPVTIQSDNTFRLSLNTADLLKYDTIKAKIQSQDKAKNMGENEATQTYRKDLVLNQPEITIDNIENVNRNKWLANDFRISGSLKTDEDVPNQQAEITIKINGQIFAERVTHDGKNWTLSVSQNQLEAWDKQTLNVTAEIAVRDEAQNTNNATSETKQFQVSINAPELGIDLNKIGRIQPDQDLAISGKVTGSFKPTDKVIVLVGTTPMENQLDIASDGQFNGVIDKAHLTGNNTIHVVITSSDDFGNQNNASDSETYSFPSDGDVILSFNDITGDNHINVTEKSQTITVSGKVSGTYADEQKGKTVSMNVNGKDLTAIVQDDLSFKFEVSGEDLIKHNRYQLSGSLKDGERTISAFKDYTVAPDALARIHLNDVNLGLAEEIGSVRLSGRLDFANSDSVYKLGHNKDFVRSITLKIGNQEFTVGIKQNDYSFSLYLTDEQYQSLKGETISYTLKAYNDEFYDWLPNFDYKNNHTQQWIYAPTNKTDIAREELEKIQIIFDDVNIQNTKQLQLNVENQTEISGYVIGAKVGDEITLQVNNQNYRTTVQNDLTFKTKIENNELKQYSEIKAFLTTKNNKNEKITTSDNAIVFNSLDVNSYFVNPHKEVAFEDRVIQHSNQNYNFPYFINGLEYSKNHDGTYQKNNHFGYLNLDKAPVGGFIDTPPVIKYYFATRQDYDAGLKDGGRDAQGLPYVDENSYQEYSNEFKQVFRDAYKQYESVVNIKFIETNSLSEADTTIMLGNLINRYANNSGFAYYGGNLVMDKDYVAVNEFNKHIVLHEILHNLGAVHIDATSDDTFQGLNYAKAEKTTETSIMSYSAGFSTSARNGLGIYDLAYLHYRFGINPNYKIGNDVYYFQNYSPMSLGGNVYIWDAGGVDTFDASQEKEQVNINLTPGSWIYRGAISDSFLIKDRVKINDKDEMNKYFPEYPNINFIGNTQFTYYKDIYTEGQAFIGYGTQIENLIGSAHADVLKGNKAGNNIYGGDGNDQIWGDAGNDYLDGGKGADTLHGGDGNDIFVVDDASDQVHELDNQGTDTIYAHVNYRLSDFVENLSLFGNAITGDGNALNNTIQGNDLNNTLNGEAGNDRLDGGRGSDTLTGGDGADTFVFSALLDGAVDTITDFTLSEDKIELALNVFSGLAASNLAERIKYDQATGALSYDADGTGNADAIHFATLQNKVDLKIDETHFILA